MRHNREYINQLKNIRNAIRPDALWVSENKRQLLNSIAQAPVVLSEEREVRAPLQSIISLLHVFVSSNTLRSLKPAFTVFMAVVIATSGWIASVHASFDSLPGDVLWSVKLATEKTQLAMAGLTDSEEDEAQLNLKFAHRRAKEFKQVIEEGAPASEEKATTAIEHLKTSLESVNQSLHDVGEKNPEKAAGLAKEVHQATQEISQTLKEGADSAKKEVGVALAKEVVETKKVANNVSLNAVEVVLATATASSTGQISSEEVRAIVQEKVNGLIADVASNVATAKKILTEQIQQVGLSNASSTGTGTIIVPSVSSTQMVMISSTIQLGTNVSSTFIATALTVQKAEEVVKKVGETAQAVQNNAQQIQTLLNSQQLLQAIQKTKELSSAITEAKDIVSSSTSSIIK